jgi:hypothetical protein
MKGQCWKIMDNNKPKLSTQRSHSKRYCSLKKYPR